MKNEAKFIYYGIVFLFLYTSVFGLCERLITTMVFYFSWNVYIIPATLVIIAAGMIYFFLRRKSSIPAIKPWAVIAIIIAIFVFAFIAPEKWLRDLEYSPFENTMLSSWIYIIVGWFRWIIVIIAYIKYYRLNKQHD